jgi:hypothetical protein
MFSRAGKAFFEKIFEKSRNILLKGTFARSRTECLPSFCPVRGTFSKMFSGVAEDFRKSEFFWFQIINKFCQTHFKWKSKVDRTRNRFERFFEFFENVPGLGKHFRKCSSKGAKRRYSDSRVRKTSTLNSFRKILWIGAIRHKLGCLPKRLPKYRSGGKHYIRKFMPFGGNEAKFLFRIDCRIRESSVFFFGG